ncbi:helix-turn-helix transcriptional regulator [Craurococcus roseus]|uniref:Helix-turn-helix transcriptional regulator n=1 Tax=Craurococcus roseus TaxID=77585 RepID=A0ABN1G394_9PROT
MPRSRRSPRRARLQELLIEGRRASGLTQTDLAARLGRPQSFVSKYETGERRLDVVEFLEVAEALRLDAAELLAEVARDPT